MNLNRYSDKFLFKVPAYCIMISNRWILAESGPFAIEYKIKKIPALHLNIHCTRKILCHMEPFAKLLAHLPCKVRDGRIQTVVQYTTCAMNKYDE